MKQRSVFVLLALVVFTIAAFLIVPALGSRVERNRQMKQQEQISKPPVEHPVSSFSSSSMQSAPGKRAAVNWDVPFTSQAPTGDWDELHGEACEEASVLMVMRYFSGQPILSPDDAERAIQHLVAANAALGFAVDDTAEEVVRLLKSEDPSLSATLLRNPSIDDLKTRLSAGSLVIVPAMGQQLHNPYFQTPGPRYHMLVLRGYTSDGYVITNDPGTRHGQQYVYRWDTLVNAIHDWNGGEVEQGARVVIVVNRAGKN